MFWEKGKENMTERDFFAELKDLDLNSLSGDHLSIYQAIAKTTAIYPPEAGMYYITLGMAGEAGEVAELAEKHFNKVLMVISLVTGLAKSTGILSNDVKKVMRDNLQITPELKEKFSKEIGDVLWYIANACTELNLSLKDVADENLEKLLKRKEEGKLHGSGDNR